MDSAEFADAFGTMPATMLITVIIASVVRGWRFDGKARFFSATTALLCLGLLIQLYFTPFSVASTFLILGMTIVSWGVSLILTKGWYLLIETDIPQVAC